MAHRLASLGVISSALPPLRSTYKRGSALAWNMWLLGKRIHRDLLERFCPFPVLPICCRGVGQWGTESLFTYMGRGALRSWGSLACSHSLLGEPSFPGRGG